MDVRQTHLLRVGAPSQAAFERIAKRFYAGPETKLTVFQPAKPINGEQLLGRLCDYYGSILQQQRELDATTNDDWSVKLVELIRFEPALTLEASVHLRARGPFIRVNTGLCLGLEDAFLDASCARGFFTAQRHANDVAGSYGIMDVGPSFETRFFDYNPINDVEEDDLARVFTRTIPFDPVKLAQVDCFLFFAIRWVLLHEQAHWLLGHLDWLKAQRRTANIDLEEATLFADCTNQEADKKQFALELQADAFATQLLVSEMLALRPEDAVPLARYAETIRDHQDDRLKLAPDPNDRSTLFRIAVISAGVSALLFELRREKENATSATHPPPSTRLLNIANTALSTFGDIAEFETGETSPGKDRYRTELLRRPANTIMTALLELELIGRLIGLKKGLYRSSFLGRESNQAPSREKMSPLARDMFSLIDPKAEVRRSLETEGGQVYVEQLEITNALYQELAPFAKVSGFR